MLQARKNKQTIKQKQCRDVGLFRTSRKSRETLK